LVFIDLDNFKTLNDTLGHDYGDLLLKQVARRLLASVRKGDRVARLGGDEFVVILKDLDPEPARAARQAEKVCAKIHQAINQSYQLAGHEHHVTPSMGVTLFGDHETTLDDLLKQADLAMYQAKASGRDTLRFFDPTMQQALDARARLEQQLREALRNQGFHLDYQPQVDRAGRIIGAEALLRWTDPEQGPISPAHFIPLAEETGLILPLGQWVLETGCDQLALWGRNSATAHLSLAINVSAQQFRQGDFVAQVREVIRRHAFAPSHLKLELTETLLLKDLDDTRKKMTALKQLGIGFSLDDFGTGYSSLAYLKRLPLDQLKIDQSFVRDLLANPSDAAIVNAILALAHSLELETIAEGVEYQDQQDFLLEHGCNAFQGYLFGRPGPAEVLSARCAEHHSLACA
jgi:diguanylate cyclase (GGDEF)-like protein